MNSTEEIAHALRRDIRAGRLKHGERLPSNRALADQFGVSTGPAQGAIKQLVAEGLVRTEDRKGCTVNNPPPKAAKQKARIPAMSVHVQVQRGKVATSTSADGGRIIIDYDLHGQVVGVRVASAIGVATEAM